MRVARYIKPGQLVFGSTEVGDGAVDVHCLRTFGQKVFDVCIERGNIFGSISGTQAVPVEVYPYSRTVGATGIYRQRQFTVSAGGCQGDDDIGIGGGSTVLVTFVEQVLLTAREGNSQCHKCDV
ncbi:hypothetical protein SDC9_209567 [bioreactor metagenome]|uniref:Uncharacterized protein n=1 Tax=bioreactor metagenome TaxID=1076179 RepID=A0A645JQL5_9ZZZZ